VPSTTSITTSPSSEGICLPAAAHTATAAPMLCPTSTVATRPRPALPNSTRHSSTTSRASACGAETRAAAGCSWTAVAPGSLRPPPIASRPPPCERPPGRRTARPGAAPGACSRGPRRSARRAAAAGGQGRLRGARCSPLSTGPSRPPCWSARGRAGPAPPRGTCGRREGGPGP
jgi:hypothetical protein